MMLETAHTQDTFAERLQISTQKVTRPAVFAQIKTISDVTSLEIDRMYSIFAKYYVNHNRDQFEIDLNEKNHVILLRDSRSKTIQGFSTLLQVDMTSLGFNALGVYSGDTVLEKDYWGNKALGIAFLKYLWLEKVKHPFRPVYWFLISKGYKTYLLMANNFATHFPRVEMQTPSLYKNLMDRFYGQRFHGFYKPDLGVIEFDSTSCCLKENVAEISADLFKNRKIEYFVQMNPNWDQGHELACIAEMTLTMPFQYFIKKTFFKRKT